MITIADVEGDIVLMDVATDAYLCMGRDRSADGGPEIDRHPSAPRDGDVAARLAAAGFDAGRWRWADPALVRPRRDVVLGDVGTLDVLAAAPRMFLAAIVAGIRSGGPISRYRGRSYGAPSNDDERLSALVSAFDALRPFVPNIGRCLPNSLCLRYFLSMHGVEADLVFGVRTHPFEAHCWIERDGCILNDTTDHVAWYTPIYSC